MRGRELLERHNLLFHKHQPDKGRPLQFVYYPLLNYIPSFVTDTMDNVACPIVSGTPAVMRAAFTKEVDFFGGTFFDAPGGQKITKYEEDWSGVW